MADALTISTTGFNEARASLRRYYYHQVLHLVPKPRDVRRVMRDGIWLHACLDHYHRTGDWTTPLDALSINAVEVGIPETAIEEHRRKTERIMLGYTGHYDPHPWRVLASEEHLEATIAGVTLTCTLDQRAENKFGMGLVEHKSTQEIPPPSWQTIEPQTAIQLWVTGRNYTDPEWVLFNYLLTREPHVPKVKTTGDRGFYANSLEIRGKPVQTTSLAFDKGASELRRTWRELGRLDRQIDDYLDDCRARVVNDGIFYQRFTVLKPKAIVNQTLLDVATIASHIRLAEKRANWPCQCDRLARERFCSYGHLCLDEYRRGGPSPLREEDFIIDSGVREGDEAWDRWGPLLSEEEE